jgi:2-methylisocitrate lyase-like PEP mutase family enzyme
MMLDIAARRADFRTLHEEGYFLLPTAWDLGSAKRLEATGFAAFATSTASLAWALGRDDGQVARDEVLAHLRRLVNATEVAVNADFASGFATDGAELMANVRLAIDTGIAAISINDDLGTELSDLQQAIGRIQVCREAISQSGAGVLLVGRAKLMIGRATADQTIKRLLAYSRAGADVLCASGFSELVEIKALVETVAPKPVDVQLTRPGIRAAELGELGVRRISVDDSIAEASWACFERAAQHFIDFGDLSQEGFSAV